MTRSTNMEHVEVLERLRGVLEHGKMGDKCLIATDLVTAAIAALSAPKSGDWVLVPRVPTPEMVQASNDISCRAEGEEHWAAMLAAAPQPPAEEQPVEPCDGSAFDLSMREYEAAAVKHGRCGDNALAVAAAAEKVYALHNARTPPPSAPVGVEALLREYRPSMDTEVLHAWAKDVVAALAQQPAAVDEPMVEAVRHRVGCHDGLDITPAQVRSVLKHWRIESLAAQQGGPQE